MGRPGQGEVGGRMTFACESTFRHQLPLCFYDASSIPHKLLEPLYLLVFLSAALN